MELKGILPVNRWLSVRFNLLSSAVIGVIALVCVLMPNVNASLAGFALAFAATFTNDVCKLPFQYHEWNLTAIQVLFLVSRSAIHPSDFLL
jgi:hypothetical protein